MIGLKWKCGWYLQRKYAGSRIQNGQAGSSMPRYAEGYNFASFHASCRCWSNVQEVAVNLVTALRPIQDMTSSKQNTFLSTKPIPVQNRLIFPLDVPSNEDALNLVDTLGDTVHFYKVGLELLMAGKWIELVDALVRKGKDVMLDVKLFDVPETVRSAVRQAVKQNVKFVTVHASDESLKAAVEVKGNVKILAVTVLTSVNTIDREEFGFSVPVEQLVLSRAKRALSYGCDGVISSGMEATALRESLGHNFLVVTPGIRPVDNTEIDDQKRTVDVEEAFTNGADYIVVGRPIRKAADQKQAAADIQKRIAALFA